MSNTAIDTLLQVVAPPRASEGLPRAGESGGTFKPALEQALAADKPAAAAPPTAPFAAERPPVAKDSDAVEHDSSHDADEEHVQTETAEQPVEETADDDGATDAVEISETAEAAAGAAVQQTTDPAVRVKAVKREAELAIVTAGDEAKTRASSELSDADGGLEESSDAAGSLTKPAKPLPTAAVEDGKPTRARSAKDDGQKATGKSTRTEKVASKSAAESGTAPASELPAAETDEASTDDADKHATTHRTASEITAEATGAADSPAASQHDNRKLSAGAHAQATPTDANAVAVELPDTTARDEANAPTDQAGAKPIAGGNAAPPPNSRSSASLDRLTASRAIHPAAPSADADGGLQVDRARFIGRVEGAVRAAHQRDGRVQVRLSPPELGSLRIEITVQHGVLHAKIEAETPAARNLLLDNLPALRERLAQQDMRVEKFDVDVGRDSGGQANNGGAQERQADQSAWREGNRPQRGTPNRPATATRERRVAPASRISDAELDVRI